MRAVLGPAYRIRYRPEGTVDRLVDWGKYDILDLRVPIPWNHHVPGVTSVYALRPGLNVNPADLMLVIPRLIDPVTLLYVGCRYSALQLQYPLVTFWRDDLGQLCALILTRDGPGNRVIKSRHVLSDAYYGKHCRYFMRSG